MDIVHRFGLVSYEGFHRRLKMRAEGIDHIEVEGQDLFGSNFVTYFCVERDSLLHANRNSLFLKVSIKKRQN